MRGRSLIGGALSIALVGGAWTLIPSAATAAPRLAIDPCAVSTSGSPTSTTGTPASPPVGPALIPGRLTARTGVGVGQVVFQVPNVGPATMCQVYSLQLVVRPAGSLISKWLTYRTVVYRGGPLIFSVVGLKSTALLYGRVLTWLPQHVGLPAMSSPVAARPDLRPWSHQWIQISPSSGTVGVGSLLTVTFETPVTNRALAQSHLIVTASRRLGPASWTWLDSRTAVFRPENFWPAHTVVRLSVTLSGLAITTTPRQRIDAANRTAAFTVGRSFVMLINALTDRLQVLVDGAKVANFPVSLGMPAYQTRSGIKVISGEKYRYAEMTSVGIGIPINAPGGYDVIAEYAIRLTPTGEFIHGAPWAYYRIGKWNGSHGCTNMLIPDAKWIYDRVIPGDVTVTTGTTKPMEWWNGPGGPWNIGWTTWLHNSALH